MTYICHPSFFCVIVKNLTNKIYLVILTLLRGIKIFAYFRRLIFFLCCLCGGSLIRLKKYAKIQFWMPFFVVISTLLKIKILNVVFC